MVSISDDLSPSFLRNDRTTASTTSRTVAYSRLRFAPTRRLAPLRSLVSVSPRYLSRDEFQYSVYGPVGHRF